MVAIIGLIQDERFGVYVLANVDHAELRHALMYKAADLFLGNTARDWSAEFNKMYSRRRATGDSLRLASDAKRITGTRPSLALSKYAGSYEDPVIGRIDIVDKAGKLRFTAGRNYSGDLEHWQYETFRIHFDQRWQGTDLISFTIGDGIPTALNAQGFSLSRVNGGGVSATH